ncbi:DDE family transposase [Kribbella orskensis]|uniref:DDE family transposase n=1 Tax=Kribbella orskensis TaxID=2512216 RepID=A0ABY2BDE3_9ACTN|nr:DDE family transposase [Kribbella sp. VKM Ac-2500]TCO17065.1 DDE family transposase [Kribbella orskensis]
MAWARSVASAGAVWRKPLARHDPAKIVTDLAIVLGLGGNCLADIAVLRGEPGVFGPVASDPTVSRTIDALAGDVERVLSAINVARAAARARVWALAADTPAHRHRITSGGKRNPVNPDGTVTGGLARGVCFIDPHPSLTAAIRQRNSAPPTSTPPSRRPPTTAVRSATIWPLLHDGEIICATALEGALLVSTRGGDYELHLGKDLSIGYLSHDAERGRALSAGVADIPGPHCGVQCRTDLLITAPAAHVPPGPAHA